MSATAANTGSLPRVNNWIHVADVRKSKEVRIHIKGEFSKSTSVSDNSLYTTPLKFVIGVMCNGSQGFVGAIDNVFIYKGSFTSGEVLEIYNQ